jgi:hypothetical protein
MLKLNACKFRKEMVAYYEILANYVPYVIMINYEKILKKWRSPPPLEPTKLETITTLLNHGHVGPYVV